MSASKNELLCLSEFAAELKITPACARKWVLERKITFIKIGKLLRIPASEIERLVSEGTRPATRRSK